MTNILFIYFIGADETKLARLRYTVLPTEDILHFMVKTAFPVLKTSEYALSIKEDAGWIPYSPSISRNDLSVKIHDAQDVSIAIPGLKLEKSAKYQQRSRRPSLVNSRKGSRSSLLPGSPQLVPSATATTRTPVVTVSTEAADSAPEVVGSPEATTSSPVSAGSSPQAVESFEATTSLPVSAGSTEAVNTAEATTTISAGSPETVDEVDVTVSPPVSAGSPDSPEVTWLQQLSVVDKASDERRCYQKEHRWACLRRDQECTLRAACSGNVLKCCHVLTPEYAKDWGVSTLGYDIQNAFILQSTLHDSIDSFELSVWPDNNKCTIISSPCTHFKVLLAGCSMDPAEVRKPPINPLLENPAYFTDLFPDKAVFLAHFEQAVLNNMCSNGLTSESDTDDDEGGIVATFDSDDESIYSDVEEDLELHEYATEIGYKILRHEAIRSSLLTLFEQDPDYCVNILILILVSQSKDNSMNTVNANTDKPWDYITLSQNPNITMEIVTANPENPWAYNYLTWNPNITMDIVNDYPLNPCDYYFLSQNPNITAEFIKDNPDNNWDILSLSMNPSITMEVINANLDKPWNYMWLSRNPNITMENVNANPDKPWNYCILSSNRNFTKEIVKANPNKPWEYCGLKPFTIGIEKTTHVAERIATCF
ncbi:hypothetical protein BDK51DRAFT_36774 [Blyttiomyces helicus]|uniref:Uncharacterized protein n=1 Tax=Blyttiomyces helicus TaxID=388810 RepID=A0A4P9W4F4_9FUNG|nr:hypothetical protein BDK51DRAFT_36774 [Blyttiomyces helicus]|eukprot:RKO86125.1 hypothetical protein BDK51DRAFT_36774 [Blyttiomyces helicus]